MRPQRFRKYFWQYSAREIFPLIRPMQLYAIMGALLILTRLFKPAYTRMIILKFHLIRKSNRQAGGFTLVEVLITMGIIIVLSALMITNFGQGGRGLAAQKRVASVVAGDLRYAQSLALSGGGYNNQQVCGFGAHFVNS